MGLATYRGSLEDSQVLVCIAVVLIANLRERLTALHGVALTGFTVSGSGVDVQATVLEDCKVLVGHRSEVHGHGVTSATRYSCANRTASDPSPTAAATRFVAAARMSPAANTPATDAYFLKNLSD